MAWQEQASSQKKHSAEDPDIFVRTLPKSLGMAEGGLIRWDFESKVVNIVPYEVMIQLNVDLPA
jgi:hypothetical protein